MYTTSALILQPHEISVANIDRAALTFTFRTFTSEVPAAAAPALVAPAPAAAAPSWPPAPCCCSPLPSSASFSLLATHLPFALRSHSGSFTTSIFSVPSSSAHRARAAICTAGGSPWNSVSVTRRIVPASATYPSASIVHVDSVCCNRSSQPHANPSSSTSSLPRLSQPACPPHRVAVRLPSRARSYHTHASLAAAATSGAPVSHTLRGARVTVNASRSRTPHSASDVVSPPRASSSLGSSSRTLS